MKNGLKLVVAALVCAALLLTAQAARAGAQDFLLFNRTGVDIHALYVAPSASEDWGPEMLDGRMIEAGADVLITFSPDVEAELWDIWVEDAEGNALYWREIDLITATEIILEDDGVARIK